jgi:hypothetical protein
VFRPRINSNFLEFKSNSKLRSVLNFNSKSLVIQARLSTSKLLLIIYSTSWQNFIFFRGLYPFIWIYFLFCNFGKPLSKFRNPFFISIGPEPLTRTRPASRARCTGSLSLSVCHCQVDPGAFTVPCVSPSQLFPNPPGACSVPVTPHDADPWPSASSRLSASHC